MNTKELQMAAESLHIPYKNILYAMGMEVILSILSKSTYKDVIYIKNDNIFGLNSYKRRVAKQLEVYYQVNSRLRESDGLIPGQVWTLSLANEFSAYLKRQIKLTGLDADLSVAKEDDKQISCEIKCDRVSIPLTICVEVVEGDEVYPVRADYEPVLLSDPITYLRYPIEDILTEHLLTILKNLELINEMEHYLKAYEILKSASIEGRRVSADLQRLCKEQNVALTDKRLDLLKMYGSYSYMRKKWKVMLRRQNLTGPIWEEVMEKLLSFLEPMYLAMQEDRLFLGDWMPELGRFLD